MLASIAHARRRAVASMEKITIAEVAHEARVEA
jgi:hypothetical protein